MTDSHSAPATDPADHRRPRQRRPKRAPATVALPPIAGLADRDHDVLVAILSEADRCGTPEVRYRAIHWANDAGLGGRQGLTRLDAATGALRNRGFITLVEESSGMNLRPPRLWRVNRDAIDAATRES